MKFFLTLSFASTLSMSLAFPTQASEKPVSYTLTGSSSIQFKRNKDGTSKYRKTTTSLFEEKDYVIKCANKKSVDVDLIGDFPNDEPVQDHSLVCTAVNPEAKPAKVAYRIKEEESDYMIDAIEVEADYTGIYTSIDSWGGGKSKRWYSVLTGKRLMALSEIAVGQGTKLATRAFKPFEVDVMKENSVELSRYIGILDGESYRDFNSIESKDGEENLLEIAYGDDRKPARRIQIAGPPGYRGSEFKLVDSSGTGQNVMHEDDAFTFVLGASKNVTNAKKAFNGFALEIKLKHWNGDLQTALIPFANDGLSVANATLPKGFRIVAPK